MKRDILLDAFWLLLEVVSEWLVLFSDIVYVRSGLTANLQPTPLSRITQWRRRPNSNEKHDIFLYLPSSHSDFGFGLHTKVCLILRCSTRCIAVVHWWGATLSRHHSQKRPEAGVSLVLCLLSSSFLSLRLLVHRLDEMLMRSSRFIKSLPPGWTFGQSDYARRAEKGRNWRIKRSALIVYRFGSRHVSCHQKVFSHPSNPHVALVLHCTSCGSYQCPSVSCLCISH